MVAALIKTVSVKKKIAAASVNVSIYAGFKTLCADFVLSFMCKSIADNDGRGATAKKNKKF